jgi:signal transduction histidine kinase
MRIILTSFMLLFLFTLAHSQNMDSLRQEVERTTEKEKFETILHYIRALLPVDMEASYKVSQYALTYAESNADSLLITRALFAQGFILRRLGKENEAEWMLKRAYGIAKRNNQAEELSKVLSELAISYTYTAKYDKALQYNFEALVVNEKRKNTKHISITCNNIGLVYFKLRNYAEALKYYERSLEIKVTTGFNFDLDRLYINIALCLNQLKRYEEAEKSIAQALAICKDSCTHEIKMEAEFGLGISLLERGFVEKSQQHFESSLALSKKLYNNRFEIENLSNIAGIYFALGKPAQALLVLQQAESIAKPGAYLEPLMVVYRKFSAIYSNANDYKNAALYNKKYSDLRDSVMSEELINDLATIQADFAERENLSTIADNKKVMRAQRDFNYAVAIIVLFAFAFIYLIMRNSRMVRRLNAKLALEVQLKTKELSKSNYALKQVNDELDNLMYKTSHDIRGPLATLKGVCNVAMIDVKDKLALEFLRKLDDTSTHLNRVLDKFSKVNEIYNTKIEPKKVDITNTLQEIVNVKQQLVNIKTIEVIKEIEQIEDFTTEPHLFYYALNSVIDNAFCYYNESPRVDSFVKITVTKKNGEVTIAIADNGVGIPISMNSDSLFHMFTRGSDRSLTGGMGLFIAATVMRKLQGEIKFQRSPDFVLTEFVLTFPLKMDLSKIENPRDRSPHIEPQNGPDLSNESLNITT